MQDKNNNGGQESHERKGTAKQQTHPSKQQQQPAQDKIEKPIKQKQLKGRTSFLCAGKTTQLSNMNDQPPKNTLLIKQFKF